MTELELVEAANSYLDLMLNAVSVYMTTVTGYLVVAYLAGEKLTRSQVTLVSALFLLMSVIATYGTWAWLLRGIGYAVKQVEVNSNLTIYGSPSVAWVLALLLGAGILGCLKFMWDVRHPKTE
jgi:hypothetical protein